MTTPAPALPYDATPVVVSPRGQASRGIGWVLLACWLVVAAHWLFAPALAGWEDLEAAGADIDSVEIIGSHAEGEHLGAQDHRYAAVVRVVWSQGWRRHETLVVESNTVQGPGVRFADSHESAMDLVSPVSTTTDEHDATVMMRDVRAEVAARAPDATIVTVDGTGTAATGYGRSLPTWVMWLGLFAGLGSLAHLIMGPPPWRATRWAWFWLFGLPLVGVPLYLLASGATLQRPPRPWARPVTGGIAFLLAVILGGMITTAISA